MAMLMCYTGSWHQQSFWPK